MLQKEKLLTMLKDKTDRKTPLILKNLTENMNFNQLRGNSKVSCLELHLESYHRELNQ